MKHVFVVQSNITYLAALGVVSHNNLDLTNVLIISESYVKDFPVKVHIVKLYRSFFSMLTAPKQYFNIGRKIDKLLDQFLCGDLFELYTPVLTNLARLTLTNPYCANLNFIEEGISSYNKELSIDSIITYYRSYNSRPVFNKKYLNEVKSGVVMSLRGLSPKLLSLPIFYQAYTDSPGIKFFGFHQDCYPTCSHREIILFDQISHDFKFDNQYEFNNCAIWIGDDCVSCANYPIDQYMDSIQKGFIDKIDRGQTVYIKFHPSEDTLSRRSTLELLQRNNIRFTVIPDPVILEMEIIEKSNVNLYGTYSSLLIYGAMMGCQSYTVHNYLKHSTEISIPLFKKLVLCN